MKKVYVVTISNEYAVEEMEIYVFSTKSKAKKFIDEQIDGIIGCGYVEDELMTTDRDDLWFFNNGESQIVITLDQKNIQ